MITMLLHVRPSKEINRRKKSLRIIGPYLWNDLPLNIMLVSNITQQLTLVHTCTLHLFPFSFYIFLSPPSVSCKHLTVDYLICCMISTSV